MTRAELLPAADQHPPPLSTGGSRDPRLDFFRGLAMLIIFIAHVQWNYWSEFIPARWGVSDAAEMFVFCSGYAAALAFGGSFVRRGFWLGTARILFRCWQIYWAHIGLFFAVLVVTLLADRLAPRTAIPDLWRPGETFLQVMNLQMFLSRPADAIVGLFSFTWIPNYFDILPMYVVILLMMPPIMALARVDVRLAIAAVVLLYSLNRFLDFGLPAEPWGERPWFFNPFAWQLLFFTGFFLARGWLAPPPFDRRLFWIAVTFVAALVPIAQYRFHQAFPVLVALHDWLLPPDAKTQFHLLRYAHFLALAYIALYLLHGRERVLTGPLLRPVIAVGQQALPTFMTSMVLAWIGTMILDHAGRDQVTLALVNLGGLAAVIAVAYLVGWIKSAPWAGRRPAAGSTPEPSPAPPGSGSWAERPVALGHAAPSVR